MSMSFEAFEKMIERIKAQGYDDETAARYARLIGDTPCVDDEGKIVVIDLDTMEILARLEPWE